MIPKTPSLYDFNVAHAHGRAFSAYRRIYLMNMVGLTRIIAQDGEAIFREANLKIL